MTHHLHRDYETRSLIDLKMRGSYAYFEDPTTDVWCCAYAVDDGPVKLWQTGDPVPPEFTEAAAHPDDWTVWAHNDSFERLCEEKIMGPRYGFPVFPLRMHRCTMVMAYAMALPGSLENAAAAVGLTDLKDAKGYRLMLQMCRPKRIEADGTLIWWDDPDRRRRLGEYCEQDVEVERQLSKRLVNLRDQEQRLYHLDQVINDRGFHVDLPAARAALTAVEVSKRALSKKIRRVSGGAIASTDAVLQIAAYVRKAGFETEGVAKNDIVDLLDRDDLPSDVRWVLLLRQEAAKSSTAKLEAMLGYADREGRMRGQLQYHGAGTGRWAGRGVQPHNLPRKMPKQAVVEQFFDVLLNQPEALELIFGSLPSAISGCLRAFIKAPPGFEYLVADYSAIEARVLAWLAGQMDLLKRFAAGEDVYNHAATGIYGRPIDRKHGDDMEGMVGKVSILALGYAGGIGAFATMAKGYGVDMTPVYPILWQSATAEERDKAEGAYKRYRRSVAAPVGREAGIASDITKQRWRKANPLIEKYWYAVEDAAHEAVRLPGRVVEARKVKFRTAGSFLWCQLPSGRALCYPYPRLGPYCKAVKGAQFGVFPECETEARLHAGWKVREKGDGLIYKTVNSPSNRWDWTDTYGGKLVENITQAVARDLLAEAIARIDPEGDSPGGDTLWPVESTKYPVVLHVHDEIIVQVPEGTGDVDDFIAVMSELPKWAAGCPVTAEGFRCKRYRK